MSIYRWDPQGRGVEGFPYGRTRRPVAMAGPAMDVYETADGLEIAVSLPGVAPEDVAVTVIGDTLTIEGQVAQDEEAESRQYLLRERFAAAGRFARTLSLPAGLDGARSQALFQRGVLTLTIPRAEERRPRQIEVKAG
jgi:HSP20 family protein